MLTNENVLASVDAIRQLYRIDRDDVTLGILPFFHAFGYSGTLWLPLMTEMAVVYTLRPVRHPNDRKACEKSFMLRF